jgi:hypothetical protein
MIQMGLLKYFGASLYGKDRVFSVSGCNTQLSSHGILFWLQVSRLGFGCMGLSGILNAPLSHEAGCCLIKEAFYRGVTFFDTANVY